MGKFDNLFGGGTTTKPRGKFSDLFVAKPKEKKIPFVGEGFSFAKSTDPFSGRPLLKAPLTIPRTFTTPEMVLSVVDPKRVATTFDPTKAQKLDRNLVSRSKDRLPTSASKDIREELGASYSEELDHRIALTLSGSNTRENLELLATSENKAFGAVETRLANQVIAGEISLLDAQLRMAKAKGVRLPESEPNLLEKVRNKVLQVNPLILQSFADLQEDPLGIKGTNVSQAGKTALNTIFNAVKGAGDTLADFIDSFRTKERVSKKVGLGLETLARTAGAVLSPIGAIFEGAKDIPVLKSLSTLLSIPIEIAGEVGSLAVDRMINHEKGILFGLSEQTKEDITQGAKEVASLTTILLGFKVAHKAGVKFLPSEKRATKFRNEIKAESPELKIERVPTKNITKLVKKHGEQGAKEIIKTSLDTANKIKSGEITPEKVQVAVTEAFEKPTKPEPTGKFAKVFEKPKEAIVEEKGKVSGVAKSIEAKAIEAKLTEGFSELAEFTPIKRKEQAKLTTDLINSDINKARKIIRGEEPLPENIRGTALITAMEEYIKNNPSADLAFELANSPLATKLSVAAQELGLAAERVPDSATAILQEVKRFRETKAEKATQKKQSDTTKALSKELKKDNLTKAEKSWDKFLDEIVC